VRVYVACLLFTWPASWWPWLVVEVTAVGFTVAHALGLELLGRVGLTVRVEARPAARTPVIGAGVDVHRGVAVEDGFRFVGAAIVGVHDDQRTTAADALGVVIRVFLRDAVADQRGGDAARDRTGCRADTGANQTSDHRASRDHRADARDEHGAKANHGTGNSAEGRTLTTGH